MTGTLLYNLKQKTDAMCHFEVSPLVETMAADSQV